MGYDAKRLPNGHLLVPMRAGGPGGLIGHGMVEIGPDLGHPLHRACLRYALTQPQGGSCRHENLAEPSGRVT